MPVSADGREPLRLAITDHVEGPLDVASAAIYEEVAEQVEIADRCGVDFYWFSEHHAHAHFGHLPWPLLFALQLAGRTQRIHLGTAIICLNLHSPLATAEQIAVADLLTGGRISPGFGSGSTPEEFALFGLPVTQEQERHERFAEALSLIQALWRGDVRGLRLQHYEVPTATLLPRASADLASRSWQAVNSVGSARIAGEQGLNMMFSHLRTPDDYRAYRSAYAAAGGKGHVAANRPVYVGETDDAAFREVEPALRTLWRRFQREGKISADLAEPSDAQALCAHPINFIIGGPEKVAAEIRALHDSVPFDVLNAEVRWADLSHGLVCRSLERLALQVRPSLDRC